MNESRRLLGLIFGWNKILKMHGNVRKCVVLRNITGIPVQAKQKNKCIWRLPARFIELI